MAKIFIYGASTSPLVCQRVGMIKALGEEVVWYSPTKKERPCEEGQVFSLTSIGVVSRLAEALCLLWLFFTHRFKLTHIFYAKNRWSNLILMMYPRLIVTVMGSDISTETVKSGSLNYFLTKFLLRKAKAITSKSKYMDKMLERFDVEKKRVERITWGIDTNIFSIGLNTDELRKSLGIPTKSYVFFSVRACRPLYQHDTVIQAFNKFLIDNSNAFLLISSMGAKDEYILYLKQLVVDLNIENKVVFLPFINHEEMPLYYNLSDSVISIPKSDGMPQSLYESMACGTFHILGNLPQYYELVKAEKHGLYVDLEDVNALFSAFSWVADHKVYLRSQKERIRSDILSLVDKSLQKKALLVLYSKVLSYAL